MTSDRVHHVRVHCTGNSPCSIVAEAPLIEGEAKPFRRDVA